MKRRERLLAIDDTLQDKLHDASAQVPHTPLEKTWLAEQRFVHGLLRAMYTADATAREERIRAIVTALAPSRGHRVVRRMIGTAAALLLGGLLAFWTVVRESGGGLPRAEAMVAQALDALARPVHRRYELVVTHTYGTKSMHVRELALTLHPGKRFLVEGRTPLGDYRAGSDGEELWLETLRGPLRFTWPLREARHLDATVGQFLELGHVDLTTLLATLPATCELHTVRREAGADGEPLVRVEATRLPARSGAHVESAFLLVSERTGEIVHAELVAAPQRRPNAKTTVVFDYRGTVALDESAYLRPW